MRLKLRSAVLEQNFDVLTEEIRLEELRTEAILAALLDLAILNDR